MKSPWLLLILLITLVNQSVQAMPERDPVSISISQDSYSKDLSTNKTSGSGVATTSAQQKGHVKQEAVGSTINSGGNLQINSNGGDVAILASQISAETPTCCATKTAHRYWMITVSLSAPMAAASVTSPWVPWN
jgi:hypothetical protein